MLPPEVRRQIHIAAFSDWTMHIQQSEIITAGPSAPSPVSYWRGFGCVCKREGDRFAVALNPALDICMGRPTSERGWQSQSYVLLPATWKLVLWAGCDLVLRREYWTCDIVPRDGPPPSFFSSSLRKFAVITTDSWPVVSPTVPKPSMLLILCISAPRA